MGKQLGSAISVVEILQDAGHIAYFAGGWVRDFLMQHPSDDIDIATSAPVEEVQKLFPKTIPVGIAFGIVIVVHEGSSFEVATFRKEKEHLDGRRPSLISQATAEEDALRRDFTINGLFYDPLSRKLYDFVEGQADMAQKKIRAIGDPHLRFSEDKLRMIRAARYATRFGFSLEEKTEHAIIEQAHTLFPSVAIERVMQEFKKMSLFAHFDKAIELLQHLKLLPQIFPSLCALSPFEIERRIHPTIDYPQNTPTILMLLPLFPQASLEERMQLCAYLKVSNEDKESVTFFHHAEHLFRMPPGWQEMLEPIEWGYLYAHPHYEMCFQIFQAHLPLSHQTSFRALHIAQSQHLKTTIQRIQEKKPLIGAEDLLQAGIVPGPKLGLLLKEAEKMAARTQEASKEEMISYLKTTPLWKL